MTEDLFTRLTQAAQTGDIIIGGINTKANSDGLTRFSRHHMQWLVSPELRAELAGTAGLSFIKRNERFQVYGLDQLAEEQQAQLETTVLQEMNVRPAGCCARQATR